jgi:hypothetical protein
MTLTLTDITKILTQRNVFDTVIAILYRDFWLELLFLARCILPGETGAKVVVAILLSSL